MCYLVIMTIYAKLFFLCLQHGHDFPPNFDQIIKKIHRLLFHVISHIYHAHFREVRRGCSLGTYPTCLSCMQHHGPSKVALVHSTFTHYCRYRDMSSVVDPEWSRFVNKSLKKFWFSSMSKSKGMIRVRIWIGIKTGSASKLFRSTALDIQYVP